MSGEQLRRQVSLAGWVIDIQLNQPIPGAVVQLTAGPPAFAERLKLKARQYGDRWATMPERLDQTHTARDGHFCFLDLPEGPYTLLASLPAAGSRYASDEAKVTVTQEADGDFKLKMVTLALPTTTLKGEVIHSTTDEQGQPVKLPVMMAEVRLQGRAESAFSNQAGQYLIPGIEAGKCVVSIAAQGYAPLPPKKVTLSQGRVKVIDFELSV